MRRGISIANIDIDMLIAFEASDEGLPATMMPNEIRLVIDTAASIGITNDKANFMSPGPANNIESHRTRFIHRGHWKCL